MAKTRRAYEGAGASSTLSGGFAAGATTLSIAAATGWPYGADPFFIVVEPGTANEEKILVTRANSGDLNLSVSGSRGADGTTDVTHADGSSVYPVFTATDADEANELASTWTTKGDIVTHGASTFERLAVGTDNYVLTANSAASGGLSWSQVDTDQIATNAVTQDKLDSNSVGSDEIIAASIAESKLDSSLIQKLVPAGTVVATIRSSADAGYLLLNGSAVASANTLYPALWAVAPTAWKSGTTLNLPDVSNKMLFGAGTTSLGASGGESSRTLAEANLPPHTHTINHGHGDDFALTDSNHNHDFAHTHSVSLTGGSHDHGTDSPANGFVTQDSGGSGGAVQTGAGGFYAYNQATTGDSGNLSLSGSTDGASPDATTDSKSANISLSGEVTNHSGSSDDGSFSNASFSLINPHLAINFQIKAH